MSYLGDTLTVGLVLVLLFGSIALYLYTRIQQTEQKVSLLESIVLDLKLTGELPSFGEFPSSSDSSASSSPPSASSASSASSAPSPPFSPSSPSSVSSPVQQDYTPFLEESDLEDISVIDSTEKGKGKEVQEEEHLSLEEAVGEAIAFHPLPEESPYDNMSVKELQNAVRTRGIPSEKGAKKQTLIDLLKRADLAGVGGEVKPGSARSSSLLEVSSPLSENVE